ncbi:MAG: hypothetical protein H7Y43_08005 [Akkermansiaceae bacterium]|nr:hypothetical protein [Verrucomicrobiales bacterium]
MTELQPLLNLLGGKLGWLPAATAWLLAIQTAMKFINSRLQAFLTERMANIAASESSDDDEYFGAFLQRGWYRKLAFVLDLVFRLKLPTYAEFLKMLAAKTKA